MKVKAVRRVQLTTPVPVYDLSVPELENFKLAKGPYVHNSKDLADAVCGAIYSASKNRVIRSNSYVGSSASVSKPKGRKVAKRRSKPRSSGR